MTVKLMRSAATACCLGATLLVAACGTQLSPYPAFNLTNAPDAEKPGESP